jgi:hypothetical protein
MSDYTKPYPILSRDQIRRLRNLLPPRAEEPDVSGADPAFFRGDFTSVSTVGSTMARIAPDLVKLGGCVVTTFLAASVPCGVADTSARAMELFRTSHARCPLGRRRRKEVAADFLQPLTFNWTTADYEITKAVKAFNETLYAHP